jgi:hypothetical protein
VAIGDDTLLKRAKEPCRIPAYQPFSTTCSDRGSKMQDASGRPVGCVVTEGSHNSRGATVLGGCGPSGARSKPSRALDAEAEFEQLTHLVASVRRAVAGLTAEMVEDLVRSHLVNEKNIRACSTPKPHSIDFRIHHE